MSASSPQFTYVNVAAIDNAPIFKIPEAALELPGVGLKAAASAVGLNGVNGKAGEHTPSSSTGFGTGMMDKVAEFLAGAKQADKPAQMSTALIPDHPSEEHLGSFVAQQFRDVRVQMAQKGQGAMIV